MAESPCPGCRSKKIFRARKLIAGGGGYAPDLLPGVKAGFFAEKAVRVVVCGDCGLLRQFVDRSLLRQFDGSKHWERI